MMLFQAPEGWSHSIVEFVGIGTTVILTMWGFKKSAQRDTQQRHEENKKAQQEVLDNQQKVLQELQAEREYLPQHWHGEIGDGRPLTTDGIIRRPTNGKIR